MFRSGSFLFRLLVGSSFSVLAHLLLFHDFHIADVSTILRLLLGFRELVERLLLLLAWKWGVCKVAHSPVAFRWVSRNIVVSTIGLALVHTFRLDLRLLFGIDSLLFLLHVGCLSVADVFVLLLVL